MAGRLPEPLAELVEQLEKLPGVGRRSALRMAMTLLKWPETETRLLGSAIANLRNNLSLCSRCGAISATDPCLICSDASRNSQILCVVPEWDSLLALEGSSSYNGLYFVLGGLLAPSEHRDSRNLEVEKLIARLREGEVKEVVLGLGSTLEAENTVSFLKQLLEKNFPDLAITRLAQGLPLGAEVKYMDQETLRQSLRYRQKI